MGKNAAPGESNAHAFRAWLKSMIGRQLARHRAGESRLFSASERGFTEKVLLDWGNFVGRNQESPIQIFYQHNTIGLVF
jgi:hypothetical protein